MRHTHNPTRRPPIRNPRPPVRAPGRGRNPHRGQDPRRAPTRGAAQPCPGSPADDTAAWVLQALRHDTPDQRALVLHRAGCWTAEGRLTPARATEAAAFVKHGWATACGVCKPAP
ncbi:DUF6233 domain-containing protein [Streptomyces sp. NPDC102274]|uniref:DUF6233 domain-containing protein n=1 Tax=Streptomyces sp. NPDC102274 TaxID=3366151 RepID=UPI00381C60CF